MATHSAAKAFEELVQVRFHLYNSLFLTLPYEDLADIHTQLPIFAQHCASQLELGKSPLKVVQEFLGWHSADSSEKSNKILFRILQLIERQVVLFDALEDSAFAKIHNLNGPGTVTHLLQKVEDYDLKKEFAAQLKDYKIRIVLTAHPTQFYPDAVLGIINDLGSAIALRDTSEIRNLLLQMGRTKFKNTQKPTPHREALSIIWYLKSIFYKTMPAIQKRIENEVNQELPSLIEMGFWPAGDRDGNPFVTHETTLKVSQELKIALLRLYLDELRKIRRRLTFEGVWEMLDSILHKTQYTLESCFQEDSHEDIYQSAKELLADLTEVHDLIKNKHMSLFIDHLDNFMCTVRVFGFHFATMDIRQDSDVHGETIQELITYLQATGSQILPKETFFNYENYTDDEKISALQKLLDKPVDINWSGVSLPSPLSLETIKSLHITKEIQESNGELGVHRYIISNTQNVLHLFEVAALAHLSGWNFSDLKLDIVPLFETLDDLKNAEGVMEWLYTNPIYKSHLSKRGSQQHIMLGFSDGTKDGGYLAANWSIYKAKKKLTAISRKYGMHVTFFDGRGGPPARGGGNTHRFYRSLGPDIEHDRIHITIQGQTISSNFGTVESNQFSLEQIFTAGLESLIFGKDKETMGSKAESTIDAMSEVARVKYLSLKNDPLFTAFLEEMTPLKYYDRLNVGSRPAKRKKVAKLELKDLRAIPFVGSWSQIKQNIPGFYGLGTALSEFESQGNLNELQELYANNLFFKTLIDNAQQSLAKTYFELTKYLSEDKRFGNLWQNIYAEAQLTKKIILSISKQEFLMQAVPQTRASIDLREKIILPLLTIQQHALEEIRIAEETDQENNQTEVYRKMVVKSLAANINASRNSA